MAGWAIMLGVFSAVAGAPAAQDMVIADIHRSEWTPSLRLKLGLRSGAFEIALPQDREWHSHLPRPAPREGKLSKDHLQEVARAAAEVASAGLADQACEREWADARRRGGVIIGNAVSPDYMSIRWQGITISSPETQWCRSSAAKRLMTLLDRLF